MIFITWFWCKTFSDGHTDLGTITLNLYFEPLNKNFKKAAFIPLLITNEVIPQKEGTPMTGPSVSMF